MQKNTTPQLKSRTIYINGKDRTDEIESYSFVGGKCVVIYKNNGKSYSYHQSKIEIVKSALHTQKISLYFQQFEGCDRDYKNLLLIPIRECILF